MYKLDKYRVTIDVRLEPGFYVFRPDSAQGKSYLAGLLNSYREYGEPVLGYTYSDFVKGIRLKDLITKDLKLIVLDRLDMYYLSTLSEDTEAIKSVLSNTIVLADIKGKKTSYSWPAVRNCVIYHESPGLVQVGRI